MSYNILESHLPIKVDLLTPYNIDANAKFLLQAPAAFLTDISCTTGDNYFTLYSGSSYYIEASVYARNGHINGAMSWQFRDATSSTYIGADAYMNFATSYASVGRVGRRVCAALVLDSDITTSMDIEIVRTAESGSSWQYNLTIDVGLLNYNYIGYPSVRIWQLPS